MLYYCVVGGQLCCMEPKGSKEQEDRVVLAFNLSKTPDEAVAAHYKQLKVDLKQCQDELEMVQADRDEALLKLANFQSRFYNRLPKDD